MFEFNGEIFYKVFEVGKIPSYMDPAKKYNEDYINQVAKNYDPVNVHEAPFWVGHPDWRQEPRAGGWIKKIYAMGKELYVSFSEISEWMKELYNTGEFKKCSVEMGDLEVDSSGTVIPYLWAIGATNIPAVKGLPVLKFSDDVLKEDKLKNKVVFSLLNFGYGDSGKKTELDFKNKINTEMEYLKKLALSMDIKLSGSETEAELSQAIENKTAEIKASAETAAKSLDDAKKANVAKLIDEAVTSGKIVPAQKEEFEQFAAVNFDACEKLLASLSEKNLTGERELGRGINAETFKGSDNLSSVTYEDIIRNPEKYIGALSEDQILKLKHSSPMFNDTKI